MRPITFKFEWQVFQWLGPCEPPTTWAGEFDIEPYDPGCIAGSYDNAVEPSGGVATLMWAQREEQPMRVSSFAYLKEYGRVELERVERLAYWAWERDKEEGMYEPDFDPYKDDEATQ